MILTRQEKDRQTFRPNTIRPIYFSADNVRGKWRSYLIELTTHNYLQDILLKRKKRGQGAN